MPEYVAKFRDNETSRFKTWNILESSYSEAEVEAKLLAKKLNLILISLDNNHSPIGEQKVSNWQPRFGSG
tara:strand:+ start:1330 stop:1539 length:210 start_codon:yes stop_codon:yes gene_type:complete